MNTFTQAVDYTNHNQSNWERMINLCYDEWAENTNTHETFADYAIKNYGIRIIPRIYDKSNFVVVDPKKYSLFQIKFA